jgi:hypothetical protein
MEKRIRIGWGEASETEGEVDEVLMGQHRE